MKKHVLTAALAATALVLAGCAAPSDGEPETDTTVDASADDEQTPDGSSPADGEGTTSVDGVEWVTDEQGLPVLEFALPGLAETTQARSVKAGDGEEIVEGSIITVDYTLTSGTDGTVLSSTYEIGQQDTIPVQQASLDQALYEVLVQSSVGEEIIFGTLDQSAMTTPPEPGTLSPAMYMAITIVDTMLPLDAAQGTEITPDEGLPVVTLDETGKPSVEVGDAEMPTELVIQPLIEGEGDELELGDSLVAHYSGWLWDGEQFDSSWERGAPATFPFVEGGLIDGWIEGLAGHKVGSQVLLVIPPELAYGAQGSGESVPPDSTLVFVVDLLGAV